MTHTVDDGYGSTLEVAAFLTPTGYSPTAPPLVTSPPADVWLRVQTRASNGLWGNLSDRYQLTVTFNGGIYDTGVVTRATNPGVDSWAIVQAFNPIENLFGLGTQHLVANDVYPVVADFKVWNHADAPGHPPLLHLTCTEDVTMSGVALKLTARNGPSTYLFV